MREVIDFLHAETGVPQPHFDVPLRGAYAFLMADGETESPSARRPLPDQRHRIPGQRLVRTQRSRRGMPGLRAKVRLEDSHPASTQGYGTSGLFRNTAGGWTAVVCTIKIDGRRMGGLNGGG